MQPLSSDPRWPGGARRCLLIDAMGTLVALNPPAPLLRAELARRFGIDITPDQAGEAIRREIGYYRAHMGEGRDAASVRALHARCAQAVRRALPASLNGVDGDALTEALLASLQFSVFDDVPGALRAARALGWRVIVVSNWDASLSQVLERVGLGTAIDSVVPSASAGAGKPDPAIFEYALAVAGCSAAQALHVGNSLEEDVGGARAAGIEAVWLNRAAEPVPGGVRAIATLAELGL